MNLAFFHVLLPERVQEMDDDLKEAKSACERQQTVLSGLREEVKQLGADKDQLNQQLGESIMEAATKDQRLGESIEYGCKLQRLVSDATFAKTDLTKQLRAVQAERAILDGLLEAHEQESALYVRTIATLRGQITKLKKKLESK